MPQITKKLEFDAGHRVLGHESKCANLHGHRYVAAITVSSLQLDSISRVVDFSVVKQLIGGWIDEFWDHNILLNMRDPLLDAVVPKPPLTWSGIDTITDHVTSEPIFNGKLPYLIPNLENPTAEVMARILYEKSIELLPKELKVVNVRLFETPTCYADHPGVSYL